MFFFELVGITSSVLTVDRRFIVLQYIIASSAVHRIKVTSVVGHVFGLDFKSQRPCDEELLFDAETVCTSGCKFRRIMSFLHQRGGMRFAIFFCIFRIFEHFFNIFFSEIFLGFFFPSFTRVFNFFYIPFSHFLKILISFWNWHFPS